MKKVEGEEHPEGGLKGPKNAGGGPGSQEVRAWFSAIARSFPLGDLHLFTSDLKYLFSAHARRKKAETAKKLPAEKSIFDIVDMEAASVIERSLDRVLKGETVSFEADLKGRRYLSQMVPMLNPSDGKTYVLLYSTDVTELKNLKHELPAGQSLRSCEPSAGDNGVHGTLPRHDAFFELTPVPMFFIDGKGNLVGGNRRFRDMMGYSEEEILRASVYDIVMGLPPGAWAEILVEIKGIGRLHRRLELRYGDGRLVRSDVDLEAVESGARDFVCATVRSLADQDLTGEDLAQNEEKLRLISENVSDLIAVLDLKGGHVYVNPSYKSIIGNPELLLGREVMEIIHPDDREKVEVVVREGLATGQEQRIEFRMLAPDGSVRYVEARGKAVHDAKGKLRNAVIVARDVTERNKLEEQYFRNQRIESLGTLAGGISHDLNNVLTPVILGVEALKRVHMDERGLAILNSISSSLRRGRDIVKQVLTFARGVEGGPMLIQTRHIVKEAVALMKETFPKSIAIVSNIPKTLWLINGDATRIDQLIMNLCVNARDAMPEGGILYISADNIMIDEQFAVMRPGAKPGPYVQLTMQDTGTGMTPEVREHIFEPFYSTKETGKGTGLGLSIVHTIVKSHKGFIIVESEPGKGTTFQVYLPAVEVSDADLPDEASRKFLAGKGELLLVVDDEVSICQITRQTLEAFGYRVVTAIDGAEAVAMFAEHKQDVALVVMDIAMPIMDGPRTMRAIRKLKPDARIIASSGIIHEANLGLEDTAAPNAFLPKPYTSDRLLQTIRSVLDAK